MIIQKGYADGEPVSPNIIKNTAGWSCTRRISCHGYYSDFLSVQ